MLQDGANGNPITAVWVGGPPGQTFIRLRDKLKRIGIVVDRQYSSEEIVGKSSYPPQTQLVIINRDFISHNGFDHARKLADQKSLKRVYAANNSTILFENLKKSGLVELTDNHQKVQTNMNNSMKLKEAISSFCNGRDSKFLSEYLKPEYDSGSARAIKQVEKAKTKNLDLDPAIAISLEQKESWNLSSWANHIGIDYGSALKKMFIMAMYGLISRVPPFSSDTRKSLSEPPISYNFKLSNKGEQVVAQVKQAVPALAKAPDTSDPTTNKNSEDATTEVKANDDSSTALVAVKNKWHSDFAEAVRLIKLYARQDGSILSVKINIDSDEVELERKVVDKFNI